MGVLFIISFLAMAGDVPYNVVDGENLKNQLISFAKGSDKEVKPFDVVDTAQVTVL